MFFFIIRSGNLISYLFIYYIISNKKIRNLTCCFYSNFYSKTKASPINKKEHRQQQQKLLLNVLCLYVIISSGPRKFIQEKHLPVHFWTKPKNLKKYKFFLRKYEEKWILFVKYIFILNVKILNCIHFATVYLLAIPIYIYICNLNYFYIFILKTILRLHQ